jgi:ABC-type polysaccharide/polyol phosphate export permease
LYLFISLGVTLGVLAVGIMLFRRIEKTFMDTV